MRHKDGLTRGRYAKIRLVNGRLPSEVLGLHLERAGAHLRIFDPSCGDWLTTLDEMMLARKNDKALLEKLAMERANDKAKLEEIAMQRQTDKAELEHLRQQHKILKGEKE